MTIMYLLTRVRKYFLIMILISPISATAVTAATSTIAAVLVEG
jgi:hypothetical protein